MANTSNVRRLKTGQTVTVHQNNGIRKICGCGRSKWTKCPHPWHAHCSVSGTLHRISLHKYANDHDERPWPLSRTMSKTEATRWATKWRAEVRDGAHASATASGAILFGEVAAQYLTAHVHRPDRRPRAVAEMERSIARLIALPVKRGGRDVAMGTLPLSAITTADLEDWRRRHEAEIAAGKTLIPVVAQLRAEGKTPDAKTVEAATRAAVAVQHGNVGRNRLLGRVRHVFNWAIKSGLTKQTPFRREGVSVITLDKEASRTRRLVGDEEERLLKVAGPFLKAMIVAALDTGLRHGELLALQWQDVDLARAVITLPAGKAKTNRARPALISKRLAALLELRRFAPDGQPHPPGAYVFGDEVGHRIGSIKTAWNTACRKADISDLHFHDLRHEFGSRALDAGAHLADVRDALGHSSLTMTSRYLVTSPERLRRMLDLMEDARETGGARKACKNLACAGKTGEVLWMKEPDGEGVASHADSESCAAVREDGGEALTGAHMGRVLSREILLTSGVPTRCKNAEGHIRLLAFARGAGTPRGLRPRARVDAPRMGTGRSRVRLDPRRGRIAKSQDARR